MAMRVHNVVSHALALGSNIYESSSITVPANTTYPAGTLLSRGGENAHVIAGSSDVVSAVVPFDLINESAGDEVQGFQALVFGRVRYDMLRFASAPDTPLTSGQCDALRNYGIVAVKVRDISVLDNQ